MVELTIFEKELKTLINSKYPKLSIKNPEIKKIKNKTGLKKALIENKKIEFIFRFTMNREVWIPLKMIKNPIQAMSYLGHDPYDYMKAKFTGKWVIN